MASRFTFAILDKATGKVIVQTEPRASHELVDMFADRIAAKGNDKFLEALAAKGVGLFRSTKHVQQDAKAAMEEVFLDAAKTTLEEVIFELKAKVTPHED